METTKNTKELKKQRDQLSMTLAIARDRADNAMYNAHSSSIGGTYASAKQAVKEAEAKLKEFDEAHPEVIAAKMAARTENARQHMWD